MHHVPASLQGSPATANPSEPLDDAEPLTKRGVRFAEDDKEDHIPIGYVLRLKKKKAEKARFLAEEEARRSQSQVQIARQKEAVKLEAERRQRLAERTEWEKERRAWEREKRAMEEERNQRKYAEEVAAARLRRESGRAGNVPGMNANSMGAWPPPTSSYSSESLRSRKRDSRHTSRPSLDMVQPSQSLAQIPTYSGFQAESRRQMSDPTASSNTNSTGSPYYGSPSSSRPPSGETALSTPPFGSPDRSRPPSLHSSQQASVEDVRLSHHKRSSRAASDRGSPSLTAMQMPYGWPYGPTYLVPPVPALPPFVMDVPLLPPSAPFMTQQYPRPRSQTTGSPGSSGQSSSSKSRMPTSGSEESLNSKRRSHRQSNTPVVTQPSSSSGRGSLEMGRGSAQGSTADLHERGRSSSNSNSGSNSRHSSQTRGRPVSYQTQSLRGVPTQMYMGPMYIQEPSPWSAPPTAAQLGAGYGSTGSLSAMNSANSRPSSLNGRQAYGRRQTAFS